jgi:hypothetical protein
MTIHFLFVGFNKRALVNTVMNLHFHKMLGIYYELIRDSDAGI